MADYSWVSIKFKSVDEVVFGKARALFGPTESQWQDAGWSCLEGEQPYGIVGVLENFLIEHDVEYHRYSDGKYEYDGDEAHYTPDMQEPRIFARLDNGGRVFTGSDFRIHANMSNEELGEIVRNHFEFPVEEVTHET